MAVRLLPLSPSFSSLGGGGRGVRGVGNAAHVSAVDLGLLRIALPSTCRRAGCLRCVPCSDNQFNRQNLTMAIKTGASPREL